MRVLYYLDSVNRGGAETLMLDVCKNAARFGVETFVAAGEGELRDHFRNSGVPFFPVQRNLPIDAPLVSDLRKIIKKKASKSYTHPSPLKGSIYFLQRIR